MAMFEHDLVRRMAERVLASTSDYLSCHDDYHKVLRHRPYDITRKIDMVAEEALNEAIIGEGICARVISEELGERIIPEGKEPQYTLVFDPVDGSNNLVLGIPYYCTSLALSKKPSGASFNDIDAGAVASISCGTFSAKKGEGAYLNGDRINTKESKGKLKYSIYCYGSGKIMPGIIGLQEGNCVVRTMGSIALDLCMLAKGSFDAVMDSRNKVSGYDILGAGIILKEAGGVMTYLSGASIAEMPVTAARLSMMASANNDLHKRLLNSINI